MIDQKRIENMQKMLDLNLACNTTTLPVFKSDLRDIADTLSALWRVVRAAENEGLDAMMDSYPQMSEALAALREGKETR